MYKFDMTPKPPLMSGHLNVGGSGIEVNSKYFMKNGVPFIPVMGEMHFSRVSPDEWERELSKMRSGGITVVSTYLFMVYHEETEGVFDFSGGLDIRAFLQLCQKLGLDVILRLGPWAHGECRNGGFPDWLMQKPFKLRNSNDEYMSVARDWYTAIYNEVKDLFYKDGGPVIGIQLENELVNDAQHLLDLKLLAQDVGFDVPLYTVTGWNSAAGAAIPNDEVIPVFGGYPEAPWTGHTRRLEPSVHYFFNLMRNDSAIGADLIGTVAEGGLPYERYPFATCELGGGIQVTHHRRPLIKPMDVYAPSLIKLGCGNNLPGYYMYHGGTNKIGTYYTLNESKATGYPNDYTILSYDFQAAIGEYGTIRQSYRLFRLLHLFVSDFGDILAPMEAYLGDKFIQRDDLTSLRYSMRTDGKSGFVFVNHYQRLDTLKPVHDVQFDVGVRVFPENEITVDGDTAFILPFNLDVGGGTLEYATCQLLCRQGNTYFFAALDNIPCEYVFSDGSVFAPTPGLNSAFEACGARFITLSYKQALYTQKYNGRVYIGSDCDIYFMDGAAVTDSANGMYCVYNGEEFIFESAKTPSVPVPAEVHYIKISEPPFESEYFYELNMGREREKMWYMIDCDSDVGMVHIDYTGDAAQLYADGKLVADDYCYGGEWVFPASLIHGKCAVVGVSELDDDVYIEFEPKSSPSVNRIYSTLC